MRFDIIVVLNLPILRMRRAQFLALVEKHSSSQRKQNRSKHLGRYNSELRVRITKPGHTTGLVMVLKVERTPSCTLLARTILPPTILKVRIQGMELPLFPSICCCQTLNTFSNSQSSHFRGVHLSPSVPSSSIWSNWKTIESSWRSLATYWLDSYSSTPHGISPTVQLVYLDRTFLFISRIYLWTFGLATRQYLSGVFWCKEWNGAYPLVNISTAGCSNWSGILIGASGRSGTFETRLITSSYISWCQLLGYNYEKIISF